MKYFKIILIFFLFLLNKTSFANENIVEILKKENNIIFIRHAIAPGNGDPPNFDILDCSTQRNLSKDGVLQALKIGKFFKKNDIKFSKVFSSEWCRCKDTAKELNIGKWETFSGLNSFFQSYSDKEKVLNLLRNKLNNLDKNSLNLMITHQVVIAEITGIYTHSGGIVIYNSHNKTAEEITIE